MWPQADTVKTVDHRFSIPFDEFYVVCYVYSMPYCFQIATLAQSTLSGN